MTEAHPKRQTRIDDRLGAGIEDSRAPLMDHLLELRSRLIKSIAAILVGFVISLFFIRQILNILILPFAKALSRVNADLILAGKPALEGDLIYTQVLELFFVKMKLAAFGGIVLAFPVIAYQIYRFVAPGLYKNERGAFLPYLIISPILFIAGASLVFFYVFPFVLEFGLRQMQDFSTGATASLLPKVSEYISLATTMFIAFGAAFQLPVVLSLLGRVGIISSNALKKGRRYALVGIFLIAAFLTPPDPFTQIVLGGSIYLLYEISILSVTLIEKKREPDTQSESAS